MVGNLDKLFLFGGLLMAGKLIIDKLDEVEQIKLSKSKKSNKKKSNEFNLVSYGSLRGVNMWSK